jgi:hypothetical protein
MTARSRLACYVLFDARPPQPEDSTRAAEVMMSAKQNDLGEHVHVVRPQAPDVIWLTPLRP